MKYAIAFSVLSFTCIIAAEMNRGLWLVLSWPALSFAAVSVAYASKKPWLLGKRLDGTLQPIALVIILPFFLYSWAVWFLIRLISNEPTFTEITPQLYLGRLPFAGEIPPGVDLIVDLTAEFCEFSSVIENRKYLCIPTLDGTAIEFDQMRDAVECIVRHPGEVYIHCAQGHGRSASLAVAVLLRKRIVPTADEAEHFLKRFRPGIGLNATQRNAVRTFEAGDIPSPV